MRDSIGPKILKSFGIDPNYVSSATISLRCDRNPEILLEVVSPKKKQTDKYLPEFKKYIVIENKEDIKHDI